MALNTHNHFPDIRDLALIGDRRTAALVTTAGSIAWYCPGRFDQPSLLAALLDPQRGGEWSLHVLNASFERRRYLEESGVLETSLSTPEGEVQITDWMPLGEDIPSGICRQLSGVPSPVTLVLQPAPDYARRLPRLKTTGHGVQIDGTCYLYASHPLEIDGDRVHVTIPSGESGWAVLAEEALTRPTDAGLDIWRETTLESWRALASLTAYEGPYEEEVADSLRALRLLTSKETGGTIAAATTSLPEVIGGARNYDYRYVWLRDAGMIVSALLRAGSGEHEADDFFDFVCEFGPRLDDMPLPPFFTLAGELAPPEQELGFTGYQNSRPVQIGNGANEQLQLGAFANVLLAAKLMYQNNGERQHWSIIAEIADFLVSHWDQPDYGIWEEREKRQYTTSKVIAACGIDSIAPFAEDEARAHRWRDAVQEIRRFVAAECLNSEGAYAAVAGGEAVDVSAALYPVWAYTEPDTPEMIATMRVLARDFATGDLYRRHLERAEPDKEGAFLAGTLWVAQYWIMRRELKRARRILDAALAYSNDLGLFAEEADSGSDQMLGNFPQAFVHAAFIGAVVDLKAALEEAGMTDDIVDQSG